MTQHQERSRTLDQCKAFPSRHSSHGEGRGLRPTIRSLADAGPARQLFFASQNDSSRSASDILLEALKITQDLLDSDGESDDDEDDEASDGCDQDDGIDTTDSEEKGDDDSEDDQGYMY